MEFIMEVYAYFMAHQVVIIGGLLAVSELLALIPGVESNSIFQLFVAAVKKLKPKA
jgi:hypothetical protein